jgi:GNAT superfamily N-acetyltransferase
MENVKIIDTNANNILDYGVCGYKYINRPGYPEKIAWLKKRYQEGLKIKILYSEKDGTQGMVETIPGEYCWRPVDAAGYLFIHCIFLGFKREYKGKGYGLLLVDTCLEDAKEQHMHGVAVVTRKGSFMADKALFLKKGFEVKDKAQPDFELCVLKFNKDAPTPKFKDDWENKCLQYGEGLTIIRADQCPYTVKNVSEICEAAEKNFNIKPKVIDLKNHYEAQASPCAFGSFCIIYEGKRIAEHPISKTRFMNIMKQITQ